MEEESQIGRMTLVAPAWLLEELKSTTKALSKLCGRTIPYGDVAAVAIWQFVARNTTEQLALLKDGHSAMMDEVMRRMGEGDAKKKKGK